MALRDWPQPLPRNVAGQVVKFKEAIHDTLSKAAEFRPASNAYEFLAPARKLNEIHRLRRPRTRFSPEFPFMGWEMPGLGCNETGLCDTVWARQVVEQTRTIEVHRVDFSIVTQGYRHTQVYWFQH